jgi:hypothetical protein
MHAPNAQITAAKPAAYNSLAAGLRLQQFSNQAALQN